MAGLLTGKVAAITGGVTGMGRAIALEYLRQGASVTVNHLGDSQSRAHFKSMLEEAGKGAKLIDSSGDIGLKETGENLVNDTVKRFGKLDVFVANAGVATMDDFITAPPETFEHHLHVNTRGTYYSTQAAAKQMVSQGKGGSIIGIASISALVGGTQQVHYTPTKAAVLSMMQSQACALGKYGIRCNALLPGTTRTPMAASDIEKPEKMAYLKERIPLGRVAEPEDMAGPAVFFASEMSRYCTGSQLLCDGGWYVHLQ
ncbi:L-rhamnose 1-dehydrogenase [Aulographum hederae CBS 113979]|uniref:L-rhamnose 1-dehydrogenase n=1 Tax=Aulographum hederae CBS 113979 TaxID=1176131 RepID=A0A6G1H1P7_9PEZI|nr:L-rhamnose 1-dehydrogenase [Aulographum hederae CBS 113979]